jgi:hypothetical protein
VSHKLDWYAYKHTNGSMHLRRYFGDYGDIIEARESPFVETVTEVFEANKRSQAEDIMRARLT